MKAMGKLDKNIELQLVNQRIKEFVSSIENVDGMVISELEVSVKGDNYKARLVADGEIFEFTGVMNEKSPN